MWIFFDRVMSEFCSGFAVVLTWWFDMCVNSVMCVVTYCLTLDGLLSKLSFYQGPVVWTPLKVRHRHVDLARGTTTAEKLRGTKIWVPTSGRLRSAPGQRPSWVLGAGGGRPSHCEGLGYHLRKFFENSDAKSCILVTTWCEISCFLKTTAKKLGDQYFVGPPT